MGGHRNFCNHLHTGALRCDLKGHEHSVMNNNLTLQCRGRALDLSAGPLIMGILNTTPDSFYDGGMLHASSSGVVLERALNRALAMVGEGASMIDIGGESSRPGAAKISAREEIERTVPLIALLRQRSDVVISIDTFKAEVAEEALRAGADMVNDISGFTFDRQLPAVCRKYRAAVVLMHTAVRPELMQWSTAAEHGGEDIVTRVSRFLARSIALAEEYSIEDIVIDPGFGFGKSVAENFQLLDQLNSLLALGRPVLAGISRKSFLGHAITPPGRETPPPSERLAATIAAQTIALMRGAAILRVHDVAAAAASVAIVGATLAP